MNYHNDLKGINNKQIKWRIREGCEYIYNQINLDYFISNIVDEDFKVVIDSNKRLVVTLPDSNKVDPGIYIKQFRRKTMFNLKYLVVPTRSKKEWDAGNKLLSMNINTAVPLATVEKRSWGLLNLDLIVTKAIINSRTLLQFCKAQFSSSISEKENIKKTNLLNNLACFIRGIHEKGVFHNDLTSDNIMIKVDNNISEEKYTFFLIDLHHTKTFRKLPTKRRLFNIAQIFNTLKFMLTKFDRQNFLEYYENNNPCSRYNFHDLLHHIESISSEIISTHLESNVKRCLKNKTSFHKQRLFGFKIFARRCYDIKSFIGIINRHHKALLSNDKNTIIKRNPETALTKFPFNHSNIYDVVVKQFKPTCLHYIKNKCSAGRSSWVSGNGLLAFDLHTPKPLALVEKKLLGITTNSYLIMDAVSDLFMISEYISINFNGKLSAHKLERKRKFINEYARTIGMMHNNNVHLHPLGNCDIMVKENEVFHFMFMNTSKITLFANITTKKRIKTLKQINQTIPTFISFRDRLRFLREYQKNCDIPGQEKDFLKKIAK